MPLIDPVQLRPLLTACAGRFDVDALDEIDSTSSEVMRRGDAGAPSGLVVVADRQTAGRGRRGRHWVSAPEDSLTFSLLWKFAGTAPQLAGLSLAVGVAVASALEVLGVSGVGLKWPNDILLQGAAGDAKLGGVLVELSGDRRGTQAIIGIGLNLRAPPGELRYPAAGLEQALAPLPDRHVLLAAMLQALADVLDRFAAEGFAAVQTEWQIRHVWQGRPVVLLENEQPQLQGICRGADADGALLIETAAGVERCLAGDLSLRAT
ncbi:MAG TPA: biotin--[acetyl-CoA-carboxylase] ligase [Rhodocyclaceae bacterium]|nr:biotin--[acetyl-CoA-carboxylase] ligase [Rhodocyclaceae bacterium]